MIRMLNQALDVAVLSLDALWVPGAAGGAAAADSMRSLDSNCVTSVDCCGHTLAVSAGTAFERRFTGRMVAKSLIFLTLANLSHSR
jgi:hypothetical protein